MILEDYKRLQSIAKEQESTGKEINWYIQMVWSVGMQLDRCYKLKTLGSVKRINLVLG